MTKRCFSSRQLYGLRNDINVRMLIEEMLRIPCRVTEGCFRFLCPLCSGFNTAINPKTNLARCFYCEKNFNTIDLVMLIRQTDFVQSAKFLQSLHQNGTAGQDRGNPDTVSRADPPPKRPAKSDRGLCHLGHLIGSVWPREQNDIPERRPVEAEPDKPGLQKTDKKRIARLEQQLDDLGRQIEKIARTISTGLPSK